MSGTVSGAMSMPTPTTPPPETRAKFNPSWVHIGMVQVEMRNDKIVVFDQKRGCVCQTHNLIQNISLNVCSDITNLWRTCTFNPPHSGLACGQN